jgi:hypothetical protein
MESIEVPLGLDADGNAVNTYEVVEQRHARLLRKLFGKKGVFRSVDEFTDLARNISPDGEDAPDAEESAADLTARSFEGLVHASEGKLYDVLKVFIPDLMPRYEFEGYGSEGHLDADEYVEEMDRSPSVPQITNAFRVAVQVNDLSWVKRLTGFFDSKMLKAEANLALARMFREARDAMEGMDLSASGTSSPSLPAGNGTSASTSSGTTDPTPSEPAESEAAASESPSPA